MFQKQEREYIPEKYEIVFENSAQSCAAKLAEHLGLCRET